MRCRKGRRQSVLFSSTPKIRKGLWSPEEDEKLYNYMMKNSLDGCSWSYVAKQIGLQRCGKSCRLRWINYLRPGLKHGAISLQEEQLIIQLQSTLGNRWSQIATHLPGRTDNEIKNYWNSYIKKKLSSKHSTVPFSSCSETNGNNCTELNIPSQSGNTCKTNSVSANAHDDYKLVHSAKPLQVMSEGYRHSLYNIFNVLANTENQHSCVPDVLDLKNEQVLEENNVFPIDPNPTNNEQISYSQLWLTSTHINHGFSQVFTSPSLQAHDQTYNTAKLSRCYQLIDSWTTLPPHEAPSSAVNNLGCTTTSPCLVDMGDSLKDNIVNAGQKMINENENNIMIDYSSFTASSGITAWSASHSYSNVADFTDVYPGAYTAQIVEDYASQLHDTTQHQSCPPNNSRSQFSAPAIISADVDRYLNIQPQRQLDCKDHVNLRYDEVNLGVKTYINIHKQESYQLQQIGGIQVGDQRDCLSIPNEEAGGGESGTFELKCEGEAGPVRVWAGDGHMYYIHTNTAASSACASLP